jgi:glycosyltransferase involved in cell wall biosynthesis
MIKLTIITINYNNRVGLIRTVSSVKKQTWQEFEYIVIDGCSNDGSKEYIEKEDQYIDYWVSEKDSGIYNAMNKAINVAKGEYLLFINSGDHLFNETVLEQNHGSIVEKDLIYFNLEMARNGISRITRSPAELSFSDLYTTTLPHPATFIKKELFSKVGMYDESLRIVSDWKFFTLALFKFNCSYLKIEDTLSTFYLDGISTLEDNSNERELVMKQYFNRFITDYEMLIDSKKKLNTNRFKMLMEIEKTNFGKKFVSLFFRIIIIFFSKNKIKKVLSSKNSLSI